MNQDPWTAREEKEAARALMLSRLKRFEDYLTKMGLTGVEEQEHFKFGHLGFNHPTPSHRNAAHCWIIVEGCEEAALMVERFDRYPGKWLAWPYAGAGDLLEKLEQLQVI